jgi:L-ascorbate peroxidase
LVKWQDEDAFFSDYAVSHKKLSELGFTKNRTLLAQSAVGVAVAATVIILSYFYEINRRV